MGEEAHAAPVRVRAEQPEVRLEELIQEPEAEEEPGRDRTGKTTSEPEDGGARIEHEVRPEHPAIAPLALRFGIRPSAAEPKAVSKSVCAIIATKPPAK